MRRTLVVVLIATGIVIGLAAVLAIYVRDTVVDSDEFAGRAADALAEQAVRDLIAEKATEQIIAVEPDTLAVRPLLEPAVSGALATPVFLSIYEAAVRDLHRTLFLGDTETLVVQLTDVVLVVKTQVAALNPELSDAIPDEVTDTLIEVSAHPLTLRTVQVSEDVALLAFALPAAAIAAFGAAVLLATDRRQALVWVGLSVVVLIAETALGWLLFRQIEDDQTRAVAGAVWDAFVSDLDVWALVIAGAGATLVAAVWWISEPVDVAARLGELRRLMDPPDETFPRIVWVASWSIVGAFLILSWQDALRVVVTLAGVVLLVNAFAVLLRMVAPEHEGLSPVRQPLTASIGPRWLYAGGALFAAVAVGVGYVAIDRTGGEGVRRVSFMPGCNGHVLLCDRRFDDVTIAASHNAMSSAEDGFLVANHSRGIVHQLDAGYRGLLFDIYYGLKSDRIPVVVTDRGPPTPQERERLYEELGAAAVRSAEELRERNLDAGGVRHVYLCHVLCEIGAARLSTELDKIRGWLDANPREVLLFIIEDHVAPRDVTFEFQQAGLVEYLHTQAVDQPWPTLQEMIESGRRVVVLAENDTGDVPWYHQMYAFFQETPYTFAKADDFNCEPNRGEPDSPMFLINHFVTPALADEGARANSAELISSGSPTARRSGVCPRTSWPSTSMPPATPCPS